jgi:hypothetical protein
VTLAPGAEVFPAMPAILPLGGSRVPGLDGLDRRGCATVGP